jgi:hypothetical protein
MLTQKDAELLIAMKKKFFNRDKLILNEPFDFSVELISQDKEERFKLDLRQGSLQLKKLRYQNRYDETITLVRFESRGTHENPPEFGGNIVRGPHLHVYKEKYGDKVAVPAPEFDNPEDILSSLKKFCEICNIEEIKFIPQKSLMSFENNGE